MDIEGNATTVRARSVPRTRQGIVPRRRLDHGVGGLGGCETNASGPPPAAAAAQSHAADKALLTEGQRVFRFDTFGDEQLWTDKLRLHEVVEKSVDPTTALKVGLKVDADVLPAGILEKVDLKSPATTVALLKLNAVVGLQATVDANNHITRLGVTCALCHSTVDNSVMAGHRPPPGRLAESRPQRRRHHRAVARAAGGQESGLHVVGSWQVRSALQPGRQEHAARPPAGLWPGRRQERDLHGRGADLVLECVCRRHPDGRAGQFLRPAAQDRRQALAGPGDPQAPGAARLPAQPAGTAASGRKLRCRGAHSVDARCSTARAPAATSAASGTDNNSGTLHAPADTGVDGAYAARTASKAYRTTPLRGLWQHPPYFHDGSAATLADVVAHYTRVRKLGLTAEQQRDLVEYLKSI